MSKAIWLQTPSGERYAGQSEARAAAKRRRLAQGHRDRALASLARRRARDAAKPKRRVAARSERMEREMKLYVQERQHFLRANPVCEWCRARRPDDLHHVRGRAGKLLRDRRFWKALCRCCHDRVQREPDAARAAGMLCAKGEWGKQEP